MIKDKTEIILDKCTEYLLYITIAFIPISIATIEIFFSLTSLVFLIKKVLKPDFRFVKNLTHLFLFLFFGFCALSLFNSGAHLTKSFNALFFKWLEYIFIFIVVEDTLNTTKRLRSAIFILLAVSGLICLDGIIQQFRGIDFLRQRSLHDRRMTATFQNQNHLAAYLVPILLIVITLVLSPKLKKQYRWALFSLTILLCLCLILIFPRGAWLGFFAGLFLLLILSRKIKKAIIPICLFVLILILFPTSRHRIMYTLSPGGDADRGALFLSSWEMIKDNPFLGKGLGTYMDYFRKYATIPGVYYAHNCFLQIWAETGIFSLLSFLGFLISLLYLCIKVFKKTQDFVLLGLTCSIFGFLVHSFFDVHFYSLQLSVLFWSMAGMALALVNADTP